MVEEQKTQKIDLSGKSLYEINVTKYFKYYNSEYLDMFYIIARQVFIFIMIDLMRYLNG